jgi:hypothetical protein
MCVYICACMRLCGCYARGMLSVESCFPGLSNSSSSRPEERERGGNSHQTRSVPEDTRANSQHSTHDRIFGFPQLTLSRRVFGDLWPDYKGSTRHAVRLEGCRCMHQHDAARKQLCAPIGAHQPCHAVPFHPHSLSLTASAIRGPLDLRRFLRHMAVSEGVCRPKDPSSVSAGRELPSCRIPASRATRCVRGAGSSSQGDRSYPVALRGAGAGSELSACAKRARA